MDNLKIENARIGFLNFEGREKQYNDAGNKNFCIFFNHEDGERLKAEGWNIRWLKPREDEDEPTGCLQVAVSFKYARFAPKVVLVTSHGMTDLDDDTVKQLDTAEITKVDLIVRPREWDDHGIKRIKAYLKVGYFTIMEDDFYDKYHNDSNDEDDVPF